MNFLSDLQYRLLKLEFSIRQRIGYDLYGYRFFSIRAVRTADIGNIAHTSRTNLFSAFGFVVFIER